MTTGTQDVGSSLPLYHLSIDWTEFFAEHPPPDIYQETVYKWPMERVRELQNHRFLKIMALGWQNPFYRRRWSAVGIEPGDIRSLDDIGKLPSYTTEDVKQDLEEHSPYGEYLDLHPGQLPHMPLKLQSSGGTTGKPRPMMYGPTEWEMQSMTGARTLYITGARPGDVMQIPFTCSLANIGWGLYKACHDFLGVLPLTTGSGQVTPSRRQVEIAFEYGTNLWVSFPEYLMHLAKVCRDEFNRDIRELNSKFIAAYLGPDTDDAIRHQLEELYGCPVFDRYGTHEIGAGSFECIHKSGLHFMEDCSYFEVCDVDTGVPMPSGERGTMVVTSLFRTMPPIIRYNLRDVGRIVSEDLCDCGSHFRRMDHFLGRADDMVKLRGTNVYPMACVAAIKSDPRTTDGWICVVDRISRDGVPREEMTVQVEVRGDPKAADGLKDSIERRLRSDLGVGVTVELVPEGSLREVCRLDAEGKPKRLLDRRPNPAMTS